MLSSPRGWLDISTWIRSPISWKLLHSCCWIGNTLSNNCCHTGVKQPKNGAKKYGRSQPGPWINPQFYYPLISIIYINKLGESRLTLNGHPALSLDSYLTFHGPFLCPNQKAESKGVSSPRPGLQFISGFWSSSCFIKFLNLSALPLTQKYL